MLSLKIYLLNISIVIFKFLFYIILKFKLNQKPIFFYKYIKLFNF